MIEHIKDLSSFLKVISDPDSTRTLLQELSDATAAHNEAQAAAEAKIADVRAKQRENERRAEELAASKTEVDRQEQHLASVKGDLDSSLAAHQSERSQFIRDRQELDQKTQNVSSREGALQQRSDELTRLMEAAQSMKSEYEEKLAKLKGVLS